LLQQAQLHRQDRLLRSDLSNLSDPSHLPGQLHPLDLSLQSDQLLLRGQ
jgi:hypothetical protein